MKKFLFVLFAAVVLGSASARPLTDVPQGGTNQADGARSMWAG